MLRSWRLYSWILLICTSNIADGIDGHAGQFMDAPGESLLVAALGRGVVLHEARIVGEFFQPGELVWIVEHVLAQGAGEQRREVGIGLEQPAAEADAVGHVDDAPRQGPVEIAEHRLSHQAGVQRRHAVDLMGADEGQVSHAHAFVLALLNERDRRQQAWIGQTLGGGLIQVQLVDHINDLHVPRQQAVEQPHGPALQRLRQQRVIGVAQRRLGDTPRVAP